MPAASPAIPASSTYKEPRVIILGCGLAGLNCARQLVDNGVDRSRIVVLEASKRIGGRIKTDKNFIKGFTLDLGAELIHGEKTCLHRLARESKWELEEIITLAQGDGGPLPAETNQGFGLFYLGGEKRMLAMDSKDPDFVHLNEYVGSLANLWPAMKHGTNSRGSKAPAPQSLRDGFKDAGVTDAMMGVADAGYANTVGAALEDVGLLGTCFLEHKWNVDGDRTFVLKGSFGLFVEELSAGLQSCIQTDWPVAKVDYSIPGRVIVTSKDGRIEEGTKVVCTLPLTVLQDGDVKFSPLLPKKKSKAFQRMGMCHVVKVILRFERPALPPLLHGCICSESFIPEFWFRHLPDVPEGSYTCLAVGFAAGPSADAVSALKPEEALKRALQQLDDMFRGREWLKGANGCTGKGDWEDQTTTDKFQPQQKAVTSTDKTSNTPNFESSALPSSSFVDGLVHDWADEPFVRGGYSYPRVDFDENTPADAAAVVGGVLFFAGEHTNTPNGMTAHAAVDSGKRAALEVLESMREARAKGDKTTSTEATAEAP